MLEKTASYVPALLNGKTSDLPSKYKGLSWTVSHAGVGVEVGVLVEVSVGVSVMVGVSVGASVGAIVPEGTGVPVGGPGVSDVPGTGVSEIGGGEGRRRWSRRWHNDYRW